MDKISLVELYQENYGGRCIQKPKMKLFSQPKLQESQRTFCSIA